MTDDSAVLEGQENQLVRDLRLGKTGEFLHTSGYKAERKTDRQAERRGLHASCLQRLIIREALTGPSHAWSPQSVSLVSP